MNLKKLLSIFLVISMIIGVLTVSFPLSPLTAVAVVDNTTTWQFGGDDLPAGQDGTAQGQNGWYYMWSPETNAGDSLDVSQIEESKWSEYGSCWFVYSGGAGGALKTGWIPDIYNDEAYDCWGANNWWLQKADGSNSIGIGSGTIATGVIGWKAPATGSYSFDVTYDAGSQLSWSGTIYPAGDGVTISAITADGVLYNKATTVETYEPYYESTGLPTGEPAELGGRIDIDQTFTVVVELTADDMIYFAADPNENAANDTCTFTIMVEAVEATPTPAPTPEPLPSPYVIDNENVFQFGGEDRTTDQDGSAQGQNGWYFMWTPEINKSGALDVSQIQESVLGVGSCYNAGWPTTYGAEGWMPTLFTTDDYDAWGNNNWWIQTAAGKNAPAVCEAPYATAVIGWKAPESARYTFYLTYTAGGISSYAGVRYPAEGDGVTISVNTSDGVLFSQATTIEEWQAYYEDTGLPVETEEPTVGAKVDENVEVEPFIVDLAAGQMIYFAADPNTDGDYDTAEFKIIALKGEELDLSSVSSSSSSSSSSSTPESPETGDEFSYIVILALVVSGAILTLLVTRKNVKNN